MARFCSNCGAELNEHDNFCPRCGKEIFKNTRGIRRVKDSGIIENFFKRDGRLNRWRYFKRFFLLNLAVFFILTVGLTFLGNPDPDNISTAENIWLKVIVLLALVPQFFLMARRLHDMDKGETLAYVTVALNVVNTINLDYVSSGSPSILERLLGAIQILVELYILLVPGTKGANKYGADPLENS